MEENRSVEQILGDLAPIKSAAAYKAWTSFVTYIGHDRKDGLLKSNLVRLD